MQTTLDYSAALGMARSFAAQLIGSYGFGPNDREDLIQELLLEYQLRLPRYNPKRAGPKTFARVVMRNHLRSLIESQCAQRRDYRLCEQLGDEGGLVSKVNERHARCGDDPINLRIDIARVVGTLRSDLARLANLLQVYTITEIARASGQSRCSIYRKRADLRHLFEVAGLGSIGTPIQGVRDNFSNQRGGPHARRKS